MQIFDRFYSGSDLPTFGDKPSPELLEHVRAAGNPGRALDLGCGDGRNSLFLAAAGYIVTGVDSSEMGVNKLMRFAGERMLADRITGIVADARGWVFQPLQFDLLIAVTLLDHLPAEDIDRVLDQMTASLRPAGTALVQVHTVDDPGCGKKAPHDTSEMAAAVRHYFDRGELSSRLRGRLRLTHYEERLEYDTQHGPPHHHGFAVALGVKE
ncbi:MAG: class I SAM-dependent methyltransferase [bacterium]